MNITLATIAKIRDASIEEEAIIDDRLTFFNARHIFHDGQRLSKIIKDDLGQLQGGLVGATYWGMFIVKDFWISDSLRGAGFGRQLLVECEFEARARGCKLAYISTMSWQGLGFYQEAGYQVNFQYDLGRQDKNGQPVIVYFLHKELT